MLHDPVSMYLSDIFTLPVNIAGLPGLSVPCGFVPEGGRNLPVGLQVLAKPFDEATMLRVAHAYERSETWYQQTPQL
jgi:aspartyl-tRNA(Asn)/glutamyl-tRNA(Gln) amidotransferase subunit A